MAMMDTGCRGLLINGGGGAGKTATGQAIGRILTGRSLPTAVIDLDTLSQYGPTPPHQPGFHDRLRVQNLTKVWATYRAAGARFVVVSGVIGTTELRQAFAGCLTGCDVQMVRLVTSPELVESRTRGLTRGPDWDLRQALAEYDELPRIEDFAVPNDRPLPQVATEILLAAGWITNP
ncbi:hypothetical protein AB0P21_21915 [Kribbella sp. NPDC056861]|uniref:hypothetical protein n=1 Tax=Kribbella sp. NPDC056861 TaxID=3154857 RepID=UPI0034157B42